MERIPVLIIKYLEDSITPAEQGELNDWLSRSPHNRQVFSELIHPDNMAEGLKIFGGFDERQAWKRVAESGGQESLLLETGGKLRRNPLLYWLAAALIILIIGAGFWQFMNMRSGQEVQQQAQVDKEPVLPGGDRAILTLADGSQIALDTAGNGLLGNQGAMAVMKLPGGQLAYKTGTGGVSATPDKTLYNTISTPRGGQYQVLLPDGSHVWLNAASSIRFPTAFEGSFREVELTGEAYFEIVGKSGQPFIVRAEGIEIDVLGTSFNVNAYKDEKSIKTTLIDGKIRVATLNAPSKKELVLAVGEQARIYTSGELQLHKQVNLEETTAWKNGYFSFDKANIQVVMRQLARWYDLEVIYAGPVPVKRFTGGMQRSLGLPAVLSILKDNNIKFEINGRTITLL